MTADHPTREERYATVLAAHAKTERFTKGARRGIVEWFTRCICGEELPWEDANAHRAHVAAALVAADPAPAQPDAALSETERADLLRAWPWPREAATTAAGFADVVAAVERILAARAAQPVPAREVSRGVAQIKALKNIGSIVRDSLPADDGADCCRERTTAGGCGCGGES